MIEIFAINKLGIKIRLLCMGTDTILSIKKLISSHIGTKYEKIILSRKSQILQNNLTLDDYEIHDGSSITFYFTQ